jgi:WD40 repeat protein
VKQGFWFLCAIIVAVLVGGSLVSISAQTSSPTPDPFTAQITNTTAFFDAVASDISANGRFVVFTSNGDVATEKTPTRNNADGNREIFLLDYAQRRIFQITNTKNVQNPPSTASPSPTPSPSPSPTPTPAPTPADPSLVKIEIDNRAPMISLAPTLSGGMRVYTIVFSSNAPTPGNFDGTEGNLAADGNSEIWIYKLPAVADVDLTTGAELPLQDLTVGGEFKQVTITGASRVPRAGSTTLAPFFADDNRDAAISDDGNVLAFISTRDLVPGVGNTDGNPELFFYNVQTGAFTQATHTQDAVAGVGLVFQASPSLSSDGSVVAFLSSANLANNNADGNAEIYVANFSGGAVSNIRQVTRTQNGVANTNVLSTGRRLSRNGALIAFESLATDPKSNAAPTAQTLGTFVYTISTDSFSEVGTRTPITDIGRFPMFTDYNSSLAPSSLVFASFLNFRPDGTFPTSQATASEGINTDNSPDIFLTQIPVSSSNTFIRLTNMPVFVPGASTRPIASETRKRIAFSVGGEELGGGNADGSREIYYLLTPTITAQGSATLSFFTGASQMPVTAATPAPSPTPSPTPTPSPAPGAPIGLAAGELTILRSSAALAPSDATAGGASETTRSPALPIELNGVSLSVNGAAAGLYFVGNDSKQINFVMPIGLTPGVKTVAINVLDNGANTDTLTRGLVQIIAGQPDIFTTTNGPGGRAAALNVTDPNTRTPEPFNVMSPDATGASVATVIELSVTGIRFAAPADITVTVGTTAITGASILAVRSNPEMPGFDIINFTLPASLAGAGDVPIQVQFSRGITTTSRPADTAPHITIN